MSDNTENTKLPEGVKTLLGILALAFLFELFKAGSFAPSPAKLIQIGGTNSRLVLAEPVYFLRIFTALFLHGNIIHLLSNSIAILIGGPFVERLVGKYWFWVIFLYSAAFGSVASLFLSKPYIVSVGASGGIMGIFSAALVLTNLKVKPEYRQNLNIIFLQSTIPSLIPLSRGIDYAAHTGGAIGGAILGLFLLAFWPSNQIRPSENILVHLLLVVFLMATVLAFYLTVFRF